MAYTSTILVNFDKVTNGAQPVGTLMFDANGDLIGTTSAGDFTVHDSPDGAGTVFELTKTATGFASAPTTLVALSDDFNLGGAPSNLVADANGNLFVASMTGGPDSLDYNGTVFEIAQTETGFANQGQLLATFKRAGGGAGINNLTGDIAIDANGDLFGVASLTGFGSGYGGIYEIAKTATGYSSTPTTLYTFIGGSDGASPRGGVMVDKDGNLFGSTSSGGTDGVGTIFELVKTATGYASAPTTLVTFDNTNGAGPVGGLIQDAAGNLFGTTSGGGAHGDGTVFEIAKTATGYASAPTTLLGFDGTNGSQPMGRLLLDANGDIFGTTSTGGQNNGGTVFEIEKTDAGYASTATVLENLAAGSSPVAGLIEDAQGNLFGTTQFGGANGQGTLFELVNGATTGPTVTNTTGNQETIVAPAANTTIIGGGSDILDLTQNPIATASSQYTISKNLEGGINLATTGSTDHLSGVLEIDFSDKAMIVAPNVSATEDIALLYQASLGRTPDGAGLAHWIQIYNNSPARTEQPINTYPYGVYGLSDASGGYNGTASIASGFLNSPEFQAKYGALNDQQFVTALYANILDRTPDTPGLNGWLSFISSGMTREHVLVGFADSQEAIDNATVGYTGQSGVHPSWLFLT